MSLSNSTSSDESLGKDKIIDASLVPDPEVTIDVVEAAMGDAELTVEEDLIPHETNSSDINYISYIDAASDGPLKHLFLPEVAPTLWFFNGGSSA